MMVDDYEFTGRAKKVRLLCDQTMNNILADATGAVETTAAALSPLPMQQPPSGGLPSAGAAAAATAAAPFPPQSLPPQSLVDNFEAKPAVLTTQQLAVAGILPHNEIPSALTVASESPTANPSGVPLFEEGRGAASVGGASLTI